MSKRTNVQESPNKLAMRQLNGRSSLVGVLNERREWMKTYSVHQGTSSELRKAVISKDLSKVVIKPTTDGQGVMVFVSDRLAIVSHGGTGEFSPTLAPKLLSDIQGQSTLDRLEKRIVQYASRYGKGRSTFGLFPEDIRKTLMKGISDKKAHFRSLAKVKAAKAAPPAPAETGEATSDTESD